MVFISYFAVQEVSEKRVPIILCGNKVDQRAAATAEGRRYVLYSPLIGRRITEHTLIGRKYFCILPSDWSDGIHTPLKLVAGTKLTSDWLKVIYSLLIGGRFYTPSDWS